MSFVGVRGFGLIIILNDVSRKGAKALRKDKERQLVYENGNEWSFLLFFGPQLSTPRCEKTCL